MMGDEMAVRSGGMYGNPESSYTLATPSSGGSWMSSAASYGKVLKAGVSMYSALQGYKYSQKQSELNLEALQKEKLYNIENFEQKMADVLAGNKMSFYMSGIDYSSGTGARMLESNRYALQQDLDMMKYNYETKEKSIRNEMKANKRNLTANMIGSVASIF